MVNNYYLEPCPFCGEQMAEFKVFTGKYGPFAFIQCQNCMAQAGTVKVHNGSVMSDIEFEAALSWNQRSEYDGA
jgi:hypothetical protein